MWIRRIGEYRSRRLDAGPEPGADRVERAVNAACEGAHAGGCTEGDESNNESILDQILAFFTILEVLELDVELEKQVIHSKFSILRIPSLSWGAHSTASWLPI